MIEEILKDYINFIRAFESLLKEKYKKDINPCSFSTTFFGRKGVIDGVIYEYDISVNEIQFSQWKFSEFIRTNPEYQKLNYSDEFVGYELYQLINKGILGWNIIEGIEATSFGCVFKEYRVLLEPPFLLD